MITNNQGLATALNVVDGWLMSAECTIRITECRKCVSGARSALAKAVQALQQAALTQGPSDPAEQVSIGREYLHRLACILDAHNYAQDAEALMALLATDHQPLTTDGGSDA